MSDQRPLAARQGDLEGTPSPATAVELYVLGYNGPIDEEGLGHPDRFVWRYAVLGPPGEAATVLAFSSMPKLIAFTRAVNGRQAFTLPTEARRCRLASPLPAGISVWTDPELDVYLTRYASMQARERVIDGLEA